MIAAEQLTPKDLQTYHDSLLKSGDFNELNEDLSDFYRRSSLFNKIQYRAGARIIYLLDIPLMILWSETRNYNVKLRSIIPLTDLENEHGIPYGEIMDTFYASLPAHLDIHQFEYLTVRNELNTKILDKMGFRMRRGILKMTLSLAGRHDVSKDLTLKKFGIEDIKSRVDIQNRIFHNKYRLPISTTDILIEISKKSYIPELSFFYLHNDTYIGYGQITCNDARYFLVNFGLIPEFRGRGLSSRFLSAILEKAVDYGIDELNLEVDEDNERAVHLYKSAGFRSDEETCTWLYYVK